MIVIFLFYYFLSVTLIHQLQQISTAAQIVLRPSLQPEVAILQMVATAILPHPEDQVEAASTWTL